MKFQKNNDVLFTTNLLVDYNVHYDTVSLFGDEGCILHPIALQVGKCIRHPITLKTGGLYSTFNLTSGGGVYFTSDHT